VFTGPGSDPWAVKAKQGGGGGGGARRGSRAQRAGFLGLDNARLLLPELLLNI